MFPKHFCNRQNKSPSEVPGCSKRHCITSQHTHTDTQSDRRTQTRRQGHTDGQINTHRHTNKPAGRQTEDRQTGRQIDTKADRCDRHVDWQTETHTHIHRHTAKLQSGTIYPPFQRAKLSQGLRDKTISAQPDYCCRNEAVCFTLLSPSSPPLFLCSLFSLPLLLLPPLHSFPLLPSTLLSQSSSLSLPLFSSFSPAPPSHLLALFLSPLPLSHLLAVL